MRSVLADALLGLLFFLSVFVDAERARAQENYSRVEVGAHFAGIKLFDPSSTTGVTPGFGARLDFNLNHRVAFETQVDFYPQSLLAGLRWEGGRTFLATAGIRGKLLQTRRFAFYGTLRPGLIHFSDSVVRFEGALVNLGPLTVIDVQAPKGPVTHFALDLGGGIEFYPTPRWIVRAGVEGIIYRVQGEEFPLPTGLPPNSGISIGIAIPSQVYTTWHLNAGIGYRLGSIRQDLPESSVRSRLSFGPQFTTLVLPRLIDTVQRLSTEPGLGGFLSFRLNRFLDADAALSFFPRDGQSSGPHDGGRILLGLFGAKAGIRGQRVGLFAKARPGFNSFSAAITRVTLPPPTTVFTFARTTNFVLDLGGVLEVYPTKRTVLRFDASDVLFYYGTRSFTLGAARANLPGGPRQDSMQFSVGFGWRF